MKVAGQQFNVAECGFFLRVQFKQILRKRFIFTPTAISKDLNKIFKILNLTTFFKTFIKSNNTVIACN